MSPTLSLSLSHFVAGAFLGPSPLPRVLPADSLASPLYIIPVVDGTNASLALTVKVTSSSTYSNRLAPDTCTCRCCFVPSEPRSRDVPPSLSSNLGTTVRTFKDLGYCPMRVDNRANMCISHVFKFDDCDPCP
ncbi:hypothetical protein B0H13DRAFT_2654930 [Mycena leptocephala]|nr:hypothetical protein B0H13DRAFT_2654930 [Mycena leptocephala]